MLDIGEDRSRVAMMVDSIDRHPREGRRHATRLFAFDDLQDVERVGRQLEPYEDSYVRTDVAGWFVLDSVASTPDSVEVTGEMRSYEVSLDEGLAEQRRDLPVVCALHTQESILRARSNGTAESVSAVEAMAFLLGQMPVPPLAHMSRSAPAWGNAGGLRTQTLWLLGIFLGLLSNDAMELEDVTSVSFERRQPERGIPMTTRTPHVGSAHLHGQHVLDSQTVCRHIESGELLRGASAMVRFSSDDGSDVTLPVRVSVEGDFVAVMTGFGGHGATKTKLFQRTIESYIATQMLQLSIGADRLASVVDQMVDRANSAEPPQEANLFVNSKHATIRVASH
jgi:hypothetical protein